MDEAQKNIGERAEESSDAPAMEYKPFYLKTKIEDMMKYGKQSVALFPRRERQTADEIRKTMLEMYRLAIMIERRYYKKSTLQELDVQLEILRHLVRMASDKDFYNETAVKRDAAGHVVKGEDGKPVKVPVQPPLSARRYKVWSGFLAEIGKMIGGYMKTVKG